VETFAAVLRRVGNPSDPNAPGGDAAGRTSDRSRHVAYRFAMLPESGYARGIGNESPWDAALDWIRAEEALAGAALKDDLDRPPPGCDESTVAAELGLTAELTRGDLQRIRRAFALQNHPDRLHPSRRDNATRRMTTANALIDKAIKSKQAGR
jgi:hypothetical protein